MRLGAITAILLMTTAGSGEAQRSWPDAEVTRGTLSFDGKSTLGDFTGTTTTLRGQMTGGTALADVRGWVESPVSTLKTGNVAGSRPVRHGGRTYPPSASNDR